MVSSKGIIHSSLAAEQGIQRMPCIQAGVNLLTLMFSVLRQNVILGGPRTWINVYRFHRSHNTDALPSNIGNSFLPNVTDPWFVQSVRKFRWSTHTFVGYEYFPY